MKDPKELIDEEAIDEMRKIVKGYGTEGAMRALAAVIYEFCEEEHFNAEHWITCTADDLRNLANSDAALSSARGDAGEAATPTLRHDNGPGAVEGG